MDLQDALKSCGWSVQTAMEKIRSDAKVINVASQKFGSFQPKRERLRDHEVTGIFFESTYNLLYSQAKKLLVEFEFDLRLFTTQYYLGTWKLRESEWN